MADLAQNSMRELLILAAKNFRHADLLAEAGIEIGKGRDASDYIHEARKGVSIKYALADVVLRRTVLADMPLNRAIAALSQAGIPKDKLEHLRGIIEGMVQTSAQPAEDADATEAIKKSKPRVLMQPLKVKEESAPYGAKPVNGKRPPVNLRHLIPIFHTTTPDDPKAIKTPQWLHLAAGDGCDLELCEDYKYFRELPDWKGVHSAVVRGESMQETLEPGDVIVMKEFPGGRYTLPKIESKDEKTSLETFKAQFKLKDRDIVIVSINGDSPTLKRIRIAVWKDRPLDWKLQITADNEDAWGPARQIEVGDEIIFHAKLIGLEGRDRTKSKTKY